MAALFKNSYFIPQDPDLGGRQGAGGQEQGGEEGGGAAEDDQKEQKEQEQTKTLNLSLRTNKTTYLHSFLYNKRISI
jgi:hypothetical protein